MLCCPSVSACCFHTHHNIEQQMVIIPADDRDMHEKHGAPASSLDIARIHMAQDHGAKATEVRMCVCVHVATLCGQREGGQQKTLKSSTVVLPSSNCVFFMSLAFGFCSACAWFKEIPQARPNGSALRIRGR